MRKDLEILNDNVTVRAKHGSVPPTGRMTSDFVFTALQGGNNRFAVATEVALPLLMWLWWWRLSLGRRMHTPYSVLDVVLCTRSVARYPY